jgi:hypothetical protein
MTPNSSIERTQANFGGLWLLLISNLMQNFMAGFLNSAKGELIMSKFLYPMAS